jgi:hypothetical protein
MHARRAQTANRIEFSVSTDFFCVITNLYAESKLIPF